MSFYRTKRTEEKPTERYEIVHPSLYLFSFLCLTVIITALLFIVNIFGFDAGLPSGKNAIGAIFGNLICAGSLITFEIVDYKRRIDASGDYQDNWGGKIGAIRLARLLTFLGLVLGAIHTFYFITEWSRNW